MNLVLERLAAPNDAARMLVAALNRDLAGEGYDPAQQHGYSIEKIFVPDLHFYVASLGGKAVGCGGVQFFNDFAELKRMYVRPEFRGTGAASALIAQLERDAAARGLQSVRLETGDKQLAALRFYAREGYRACDPFPPYTELDPFSIAASVFLEKRL